MGSPLSCLTHPLHSGCLLISCSDIFKHLLIINRLPTSVLLGSLGLQIPYFKGYKRIEFSRRDVSKYRKVGQTLSKAWPILDSSQQRGDLFSNPHKENLAVGAREKEICRILTFSGSEELSRP